MIGYRKISQCARLPNIHMCKKAKAKLHLITPFLMNHLFSFDFMLVLFVLYSHLIHFLYLLLIN